MELSELQKYQKHIKDFHCKTCIHIRMLPQSLFYCDTRKSFTTKNQKLSIKAGSVACPLYETLNQH